MIHLDAALWGLAALLGCLAGSLLGLSRRGAGSDPPAGWSGRDERPAAPPGLAGCGSRVGWLAASGMALLALVAGLGRRAWSAGGIVAGPADGLALLAAGALCLVLWQGLAPRLRPPAHLGGARRVGQDEGNAAAAILQGEIEAVSAGANIPAAYLAAAPESSPAAPGAWPGSLSAAMLILAGLVALAAALAAWRGPAPAAAPGGGWLFAVRAVAAGLGLAGWLGVAASLAAAAARRRPRPAARPEEDPPAAGEAGAFPPTGRVPAVPPAAAFSGRRELAFYVVRLAPVPLRCAYPWLTLALLAGSAWSMAAYATPWRGRPAELWPAVAWLLAGAYLYAVSGWRPNRLHPALLALLALLGLLASLLAAWQMPALFS